MVELHRIAQHELQQLVPAATQIITVNNRFARRVLAYFQQQLQGAQQAMAIAEVLPLTAWFRRCEEDLILSGQTVPAAYVLDAFSAHQVWETVIAQQDNQHNPLIDKEQAAKLAYDADRLIDEWHIEVLAAEQNADHEHFLAWRTAYEQYLHDHDLDDENRSINRIIEAFADGQMPFAHENIVWVGFHEYSPRMQRLQSALAARGIKQYDLQWSSRPATQVQQVQAASMEDEWVLAANWVQEQLQQHPQGRYAIVAAELEQQAPLARRVFDQYLDCGWNMAVGRPLSEWPAVRQILAWLDLLYAWQQAVQQNPQQPVVAPDRLGPALLSGGFMGGDFWLVGAQIDAKWRLRERLNVGLNEWEQALGNYAPKLLDRWQAVWPLLLDAPKQATVNEWAPLFRQWLGALKLPDNRPLDTVTYQVYQAFEQRLQQFSQYGLALGALSLGQALRVFRRLCQEALFQPERDPNAQVDILGILEAEGGHWDGVWVLGLTDSVLPAAPKPNPFIPYAALARQQAPRATPEKEYEWAQTSFERLLCSAPQILLSAPQFEGEESLRPSPFISAYPIYAPAVPPHDPTPLDCEQITDEQAPAVDFSRENLRGGAALIDTFARNPQWAFVRYRLLARGLPAYAQLSQTHVLGSFIHELLEKAWRGLAEPTRAGLQRWLQGPHAEQTLATWGTQLEAELLAEYPAEIAALVSEWGQQTVYQWLVYEAERALDFRCIAAEEQAQYDFGPLSLSLRLDRIDQLADGRYVLVDYKTGQSAELPLKKWLRPRPVDLQLPLYASLMLSREQSVAGLAIGKANVLAIGFEGVGDELEEHGFAPFDGESSWGEQLQQWQKKIHQLVDDLLAGQADNSFYARDDLRYCDALPFLRITAQGDFYEQ